jgi:hypothetical protein
MWQQMFDQAEAGIIKENAKVRLQILDSLDRGDQLARLAAEFERRHGRLPARLEELSEAGLLKGPLVDAGGVPFGYDPRTGHVFIDKSSPMWRPE